MPQPTITGDEPAAKLAREAVEAGDYDAAEELLGRLGYAVLVRRLPPGAEFPPGCAVVRYSEVCPSREEAIRRAVSLMPAGVAGFLRPRRHP